MSELLKGYPALGESAGLKNTALKVDSNTENLRQKPGATQAKFETITCRSLRAVHLRECLKYELLRIIATSTTACAHLADENDEVAIATLRRLWPIIKTERGLRPGDGKEALIVLDHAGNTARLGLVTDQACDSLDDGTQGAAYDKRAGAKAPEIHLCPECSCVVPPRAPACPQCGHTFPATTDILESGGELVEFNSGERGGQGAPADKRLWHGALAWIAAENDYKPGWIANQFKTKFGHWPIARYAEPRRPTVEISNWVRSRQIAFARARRRA
jgi:hypothetical protein